MSTVVVATVLHVPPMPPAPWPRTVHRVCAVVASVLHHRATTVWRMVWRPVWIVAERHVKDVDLVLAVRYMVTVCLGCALVVCVLLHLVMMVD